MRYHYSFHRTRERAESALEHYFATGEVVEGEFPRIERRTDHRGKLTGYQITLGDNDR